MAAYHNRALTPEKLARLRKVLESDPDLTAREVGLRFGMSPERVACYRREWKLEREKCNLTNETRER